MRHNNCFLFSEPALARSQELSSMKIIGDLTVFYYDLNISKSGKHWYR